VQLDLTIVIAAHNAADTIGEQLEALRVQTWGGTWEVVVSDNASTDATREIVRSFQEKDSRLVLADAVHGRGAGYARNEGSRVARGESLVFCDADDVVGDGWVAARGEALRSHEFVAGALRFDLLNPEWLRTAFYAKPPEAVESFEGIFPIAATCNLGLRRVVFDEVGGFDETFLTGQDLELCLRVWRAGCQMVHVPDAIVQYRYRGTFEAVWKRCRQYGAVGPAIARRLAESGGPRPPRFKGLKNYLWLIRRLPTLRTKQGRARYVVVAGTRLGRLMGSLRSRTLYL